MKKNAVRHSKKSANTESDVTDGITAAAALDQITKDLLQRPPLENRCLEIPDALAIQAVKALENQPPKVTKLVKKLKLAELAENGHFFDFLQQIDQMISWGDGRKALVGILWAGAFNQSSSVGKDHLLNGALSFKGLFMLLYSLPAFVEHVTIEAEIIAGWLVRLKDRLGESLSGGFQDGIARLAISKPMVALAVLESWSSTRPTPPVESIAVAMLACLRVAHPKTADALDNKLRAHQDEERRVIYHRSWLIFDKKVPIPFGQYKSLVSEMVGRSEAEFEEAFNFLRWTIQAKHRCDASFEFALRWIQSNKPATTSANWTHWIIALAKVCDERAEALALPLFRGLIPSVLPIEKKHDGTWCELEELFVNLSGISRDAFVTLFFAVAEQDPGGLAAQFSRSSFVHFQNTIQAQKPEELVFKALSSLDMKMRHLGMIMFSCLQVRQLSLPDMMGWSDTWVAMLIHTQFREIFYDRVITRFFISILPRVECASQELKNFYIAELVYQMKNLPGECLDLIKSDSHYSENIIIKQAILAADDYFSKLQKAKRSAINSMVVPGFQRARTHELLRQSREVSEGTEKHSVLFDMMSKSYSLYGGKKWQQYIAGQLNQVSSMSDFSHSMELPRYPTMDPDGYARRRQHAAENISLLVAEETDRRKETA